MKLSGHKQLISNARGFTIVELLIVVVVIAILAAITIVAYNGIQARALDSSRDSAARTIRSALEMYKADNNDEYPRPCTPNSGCNATLLASALVPKYTSMIPEDPKSGTTMQYVVSVDLKGYGLLVEYQSKPRCKFLAGPSVVASWWGAAVPAC